MVDNAYNRIGEEFVRGFITEEDFPIDLLNKFLISRQRDRVYVKAILCNPLPELSEIVEEIFTELEEC